MVAEPTVHPLRTWINDQVDSMELEDVLVADGHDHAILGLVEVGDNVVVAYSGSKIIEGLINQGMTDDEAVEYYEFNIKGAYMGPTTPIYVEDRFVPYLGE